MSKKENIIETPPSAAPVVQALRSIGYNPKTAIADLIDNSLDAKSKNIEIIFEINNEIGQFITICDDGKGMDEDELQIAMNIGSKDPRSERSEAELGRFGMGLKTASFSMGRRLSVLTKKNGIYSERCWDLDHITKEGKWELYKHIPEDVRSIMEDINSESGTIIFVDKIDRFIKQGKKQQTNEKRFYKQVDLIKKHLEFIFHKILKQGFTRLDINGVEVLPWDPFLSENFSTIETEMQPINYDNKLIYIKSYIVPHPTSFNNKEFESAGGPGRWYDQQGIYIYRENRLLHYGDWLGIRTKDTASQLARIRVDLPNTLDDEFQIDIKKSSINAPEDFVEKIIPIIDHARDISKQVFYFRSTSQNTNTKKQEVYSSPWQQSSKDGQSFFVISRTHPVLRNLYSYLENDEVKELNLYLQLLEIGSPSNIFISAKQLEEEVISFEKEDVQIICSLAKNLLDTGHANNKEEVANMIYNLPGFNQFNLKTLYKIMEAGGVETN
ncbi:ATP-binding protein [Bacillus sp. E(2018)]|uniref:ATP-binding protein n=1 Tax=Bacillus sp. E(2018) TaxID=2502239 RepID=UPI0010F7C994|nr:ATP-binding protein [Bacillus sp. E(2018)]